MDARTASVSGLGEDANQEKRLTRGAARGERETSENAEIAALSGDTAKPADALSAGSMARSRAAARHFETVSTGPRCTMIADRAVDAVKFLDWQESTVDW